MYVCMHACMCVYFKIYISISIDICVPACVCVFKRMIYIYMNKYRIFFKIKTPLHIEREGVPYLSRCFFLR